jgi:hypothetical protein
MTYEEKKYKAEQRERMRTYVVGSKDSTGNTISKMFSKGDEYIIYEIETKYLSDSIKVLIDTEIEDNNVRVENYSSVREKFTKIKGLLYKVIDDTSIKARIGHILAHGINGKVDEANRQFDDLIVEIETEYANQSRHRINYLLTTLVILMGGLTITSVVYYYDLFLEKAIIREVIYITSFAFIGGFISISRKLKSTVFQKDVQKRIYFFYAVERMTIAGVAGIVLFFAMKSNLAFGIIQELEYPIFGYVVFSAVAGFSETLIPNLLIRLEDKTK